MFPFYLNFSISIAISLMHSYSFYLVSLPPFSSPFHALLCCHLSFWFYCSLILLLLPSCVFVHWPIWLLIWPSLISCLVTAYLCSILQCALQFLENANLFYSFIPTKYCRFSYRLFIWKAQYGWHHLYRFSPASTLGWLPSLGSQTPHVHLCWHLCHVIVYVCLIYFSEHKSPFFIFVFLAPDQW